MTTLTFGSQILYYFVRVGRWCSATFTRRWQYAKIKLPATRANYNCAMDFLLHIIQQYHKHYDTCSPDGCRGLSTSYGGSFDATPIWCCGCPSRPSTCEHAALRSSRPRINQNLKQMALWQYDKSICKREPINDDIICC